jgi:hypothetical protein
MLDSNTRGTVNDEIKSTDTKLNNNAYKPKNVAKTAVRQQSALKATYPSCLAGTEATLTLAAYNSVCPPTAQK